MSSISLQSSPAMTTVHVGTLNMLVSKTDHENALLYFHGFPGPFEVLPPGELRIADQLHSDIVEMHDYYYPLYSLKSGGKFNFEETIQDGFRALDFLHRQKAYKSVTIVGQSWGAVIALALSRKFYFKKILLITPFLFVPTGSAALQTIQYYSEKYPELLPPGQVGTFVGQIERIAASYCPKEAFLATTAPSIVFASDADEVVPFKKIADLVSKKATAKLIILEGQTHKVEGRTSFRKAVQEILESPRSS
jgi:esterase/lipase